MESPEGAVSAPRAESWQMKLSRWRFNWFPAYRGTGARITFIADDWSEVHLRLPLCRQTRNYVGTIFGGSMFAAVDPVPMVMLIHRLGPEYVVWDKAAEIRFKRPGRDTLYASCCIDDAEVSRIRDALREEPGIDRSYAIDLFDAAGNLHASVEKVVKITRR